MMNFGRIFIFTFCFLLFGLELSAQNTMDVLAYLEGENAHDCFGKYITSLDFNGDGYDDLVVVARTWGSWLGKLYCYYGGDIFNTESDFTISGNLDSYVGWVVTNLGDLNNDGYEDLGMKRETQDNTIIQILLGNTIQDTIPDFEFYVPDENDYESIRKLGDINGDGYDDAGIIVRQHYSMINPLPLLYYICYGNEDTLTAEFFTEEGNSYHSGGFSGIGDVNNDGYDDFCIGYCYDVGEDRRYTNTLYYGAATITNEPDLILWDEEYTYTTLGLPIGDFNADGYADFCGHLDSFGRRIWLGDEVITTEYDLVLYYGTGSGLGFAFDFGDINNDGHDDIAIGSPYAGLNGKAYLYLGGENPNNTFDFEFEEPPGVNHDYGTSVTVGRFDGDEYDDIAISGPMNDGSGNNHGYVHIFAGNGELDDLVSAGNGEIPEISEIEFNAYPNPFNPTVTFEIKFTTESTENTEMMIEVFNIKGQKVKTLPVSPSQSHTVSITWNAENKASSVYFYRMRIDGFVSKTKKMILLK